MMNDSHPRRQYAEAGLCATCREARTVETDRGARFVRCGLSDRDPAFARYPALPVRLCGGYNRSAPG